MKTSTKRITAILIALIMLIGCSVGLISAYASPYYKQNTLINSIDEALGLYEQKVSSGNIFTNMQAAYDEYVNLSALKDRYYYGNENIDRSLVNTAISRLNAATGNMKAWSAPGAATTANMGDSDLLFQQSGEYPWSSLKGNFNQVIWAQKNYDAGADGGKVTAGVRGSADEDSVSYYLCYPAYVLLWDGSGSLPTFGVLIEGDTEKSGSGGNNYRYFYGAAIYDTSTNTALAGGVSDYQGLSLQRGWGANNAATWGNTTRDFGWNLASSTRLTYSATTLTDGNTSLWLKNNAITSRRSYHRSAANMVTYNMPSSATGYVLSVYPSFRTYTGSQNTPNGQGNWNSDIVREVKGNQPVYVLNYKALYDVMTDLASKLKTVNNYREGGLSSALAALDKASAYNYNTDFAADYNEGGIAAKVSEVNTNFTNWANAMKVTQEDQYGTLRAAIAAAMDTYFEDTTAAVGVGGTNPLAEDGLNNKYCTPQWDAFAAEYAKAIEFIRTAGDNNDYSNGTQAITNAGLLNDKFAAVKVALHVTGDEMKYKFPEEGGYKKATCEADGLAVQYSDCPNCKEEFINDDEYKITKVEHTLVAYEGADEATCTQGGVDPYFYCERSESELYAAGCGKKFEDNNGTPGVEIQEPQNSPALGHDFGEAPWQEKRDADCFNGSLKEIWYCKTCKTYYLDNDLYTENVASDADTKAQDDAINHKDSITHIPYTENSCLQAGTLEHYECTLCGTRFKDADGQEIMTEDTTLPQLAHVYENYVYDEESQADDECITPGTMTATCENGCGTTDTKLDPNHPAIGHKFESDSAVTEYSAPACYDAGNIKYYTCDNCGNKYATDSDSSTVPLTDEQIAIAATGQHTLVLADSGKEATCSEPGWDPYYKCIVCSKLFDVDTQEGDIEAFDEEHCITTSIEEWEGYKAAGDHVRIDHAAKQATCKEGDNGWDAYWECAICGQCFDEDDEMIAENKDAITEWEGYHSYEEVAHQVEDDLASDPTCVEEGFEEHYECSVCGKWFLDSEGTEPTEEKPVADINPNNHTGKWIEHSVKEATCQEEGWTELVWECEDCGFYYLDENKEGNTTNAAGKTRAELGDIITPTIEHDQKTKVATEIGSIEATCTTPGQQMYYLYCSMCNTLQGTTSEAISTIPHTPNHVEKLEPTCYSEGLEEHYECTVCKQLFDAEDTKCESDPISREDIVIASDGHKFTVEGEKKVEETCNTNAEYEYSCEYECGATAQLEKANTMTDHNMTKHEQKDATCLTPGVPETYYSCDQCGLNYADDDEYTTNIYSGELSTPATGHKYTVGQEGTPATCASDGTYTYYVCSNENCDLEDAKFLYDSDSKTYTEVKDDSELVEPLNKYNHTDLKGVAAQAATCSPWTVGYKSHIYCSGCDNYYASTDHYGEHPLANGKADLKIDPTHTLTHYDPQDPTCLEDGNNEVYVCDICSEAFKDYTPNDEKGLTEEELNNDIIIKAEGHTFGAYVPAVEATCKVEGSAGHVKCSECEIAVICAESEVNVYWVLFYEGDDTNKTDLGLNENNHKNIKDFGAEAPTCLEDGTVAHKACEDCGTLFDVDGVTVIKDITDPATGHTFQLVTDNAKDATCLAEGELAHYICTNDNCDLNGAWFLSNADSKAEAGDDASKFVIGKDLTNHANLNYDKGTEATCSPWTEGVRPNYHCDCGVYYELDDALTQANPLTEADFVSTPEHKLADRGEQPRTCLEDGYKQYWECTECNQFFLSDDATAQNGVDYDTEIFLKASGHNEVTKIENEVPGEDCQHYGTYDEVVYCDNDWCDLEGAALRSETKESDEFGPHNPGEAQRENEVAASCETAGSYDLVTRCTVCKEAITEDKDIEIPATGHSWGDDWVIIDSPDCVNGGSRQRECLNGCGTTETEGLDPNGHDWEADYTIDKAPTCTKDGSKSIHCKNCDAKDKSETVPALGHDWVIDKAVAPTATKTGLTEGKHCSRGDAVDPQEVIPATGEIPLEILEGADQTYVLETNEIKAIRCSGNFNMFIELLLDGEHVDESNYTLKEGSTIVTFNTAFLNTLAPGKYDVTLVYTYDTIDTTLTVVEKTAETTTGTTESTTAAPGSGSNDSGKSPNTGLVITIPALSLAALAGSFFSLGYARKKKNEDED